MNFLGILIVAQIYFLLFIGYYSSKAVFWLMIQIIVAVSLDVAHLSITTFTHWKVMPDVHSSNQVNYYFGWYCVLLGALVKTIIVFKLYEFRIIKTEEEYFMICGKEFPLRKVLYTHREKEVSQRDNTGQSRLKESRLRESRLKESKAILSARNSRIKESRYLDDSD